MHDGHSAAILTTEDTKEAHEKNALCVSSLLSGLAVGARESLTDSTLDSPCEKLRVLYWLSILVAMTLCKASAKPAGVRPASLIWSWSRAGSRSRCGFRSFVSGGGRP